MKNKVFCKTINLPVALRKLLCDHFKTDNISEAIRQGLVGFLSDSSFGKRMDAFALHQLLSIQERMITEKCPVRISKELNAVIANYTVKDTEYGAIAVMLANYLYFSEAMPPLSDLSIKTNFLHLVKLLGSKWNPRMQSAIANILQSTNKMWAVSVEPFVGALGIFANFQFASNEIINDIDLLKANLYRVIRDSHEDFLVNMLCQPPTQETFEQSKKDLKNNNISNEKTDIEAATSFLLTNMLSLRNGGCSYKEMTKTTYREKIDAIAPLHERLKDTEICGLHSLEVIEKHLKDENAIFIVDPPYLDTNVYEQTLVIDKKYDKKKRKFNYPEHAKLAKLLRETHQKYGNDFIYFCRITVTRKHGQKNSENTESTESTNAAELASGDRHMQGRIDDLYWGYGFYYIDIPYDKDGTIERIITSFNFAGATVYGKGRE